MPNDRLNEKAGQRRSHPKNGELVDTCSERLEDTAHLGGLKCETDLNSKKAERDIHQPRKRLPGFWMKSPLFT